MDIESLLHTAEHQYSRNSLFRALVDTIVEAVNYETGDDEIDYCINEVARRAASISLLLTEGE